MDDQWDHRKLRARVKPGVVGSLPAGMKFDVAQGRRLQDFLAPVAKDWARVISPVDLCCALYSSQKSLTH